MIGVGGFLGMGEHDVAIPLNRLQRGQDNRLTTTMIKEELGKLPEHQEGGAWAPLGTGRTVGRGTGQ